MSELLNLPREFLVVPAADIRMLADLSVSMELACSLAAAVLPSRLDNADGDLDLEDTRDLKDDHAVGPLALGYAERGPGCKISDAAEEDNHSSGDVRDEPHDAQNEAY